MGFLSFSLVDGVFSLKLDFVFWRPRMAKKKSAGAERGPVPLPPPFALPPVRSAVPFDVLVSAPALRDSDLVRKYTPAAMPRSSDLETRAADLTMLDDDLEPTYQPVKTDLARQRREVRQALRDITL